jgi:hypothetical protein
MWRERGDVGIGRRKIKGAEQKEENNKGKWRNRRKERW